MKLPNQEHINHQPNMTQNASRARCSRRLRDLRARRPADEERHDVPHTSQLLYIMRLS